MPFRGLGGLRHDGVRVARPAEFGDGTADEPSLGPAEVFLERSTARIERFGDLR